MNSVSVCMATYNGEKFIARQLESILSQLQTQDEIVIFDDWSDDSTVEIIERFNDPRIRLFKQKKNVGVVKNFEAALRQVKCDLIFLSDQDDCWEPQKVYRLTKLLETHDLVLHDCSIVNEEDKPLYYSFFESHHSGLGLYRNLIRNSFMGCCMAFHRRILEKALPFPVSIRTYDQWIGLVAEKYFRVLLLPETLIKYRRHTSNLSSTAGKSRLSLLEKISYRLALMYNLGKV